MILSNTRTQSPLDGGVKFCGFVASYVPVPIWVATPVPGLYHQAVIVLPREAPLTVIVRGDGRYARIEDPSAA